MSLDPYHFTLILVALITGIISPICVQLFKYSIFNKNKSKKCDVTANLKNEDLINHKLIHIRESLKTDRVWIWEFHNGGHTFSGKSLQKFSQTYEVVSKGISKEATSTQNLPTSLFSTFFNFVAEEGIVFVCNVDDEDTSLVNSVKSFLDSRGVKSFAAAVIKNIEGNTIGILGLDFVTHKDIFREDEIASIKFDANNLAGYLENSIK